MEFFSRLIFNAFVINNNNDDDKDGNVYKKRHKKYTNGGVYRIFN